MATERAQIDLPLLRDMPDGKGSVPEWDGEVSSFEIYRSRVQSYVEGTDYAKRYLCGPRVVNRFTRKAATAVERKKPG